MKAEKPIPPVQKSPTLEQKREIMLLLTDSYDIKAGRYSQNNTDDVLADVLGVLPGWVSQIREEFFGPDGGNEDINALLVSVETTQKQVSDEICKVKEWLVSAESTLGELGEFKTKLDRIKAAVGPRNLKRAGLT